MDPRCVRVMLTGKIKAVSKSLNSVSRYFCILLSLTCSSYFNSWKTILTNTMLRSNYFSAVIRNWRTCLQVISPLHILFEEFFFVRQITLRCLFAQAINFFLPSWSCRWSPCWTPSVDTNTFPSRITWLTRRSSAKIFHVVEELQRHLLCSSLFDKHILCQNPIRSWQFDLPRLDSLESSSRKEFLKT